jgi:hypothetical protein
LEAAIEKMSDFSTQHKAQSGDKVHTNTDTCLRDHFRAAKLLYTKLPCDP